ncbi:MAG: hypothetical protein ACRDZU_05795 [Acidimicrobiales bacterium]
MLDRRQFLARVGVLSATFGVLGPTALRTLPSAGAQVDPVAMVLRELSRDTFSGLCAFCVPGADPYSVAQGVQNAGEGSVDARTTDFLLNAADFFVPLPDGFARAVVSGLRTSSVDTGFPIPPELLGPVLDLARTVDDEIVSLLEGDEAIPLSLVFAMTMNFFATRVNPLAVNGTFLSPFARLTWAEKAMAWEMFEQADPDLVAAVDSALPEPATETVSGVLRFAAGALLEFCAFATYSEYSTFDPETRTLTAEPVGHRISTYTPATAGWDELKGYWKGRTEADP